MNRDSTQRTTKQTKILQNGKKKKKKATGQRCVNNLCYVESEIQTERFCFAVFNTCFNGQSVQIRKADFWY